MGCIYNYPSITLNGNPSESMLVDEFEEYVFIKVKLTEDIDISTIGETLVEEYALISGDKVALTGQNDTEENGIYILDEEDIIQFESTLTGIFLDLGATATDTLDGDLTREIEIDSSEIDFSESGIYYIIYSVTNIHDLTSIVKRRIKVTKEGSSLFAIGDINIANYSISSSYDIPQ